MIIYPNGTATKDRCLKLGSMNNKYIISIDIGASNVRVQVFRTDATGKLVTKPVTELVKKQTTSFSSMRDLEDGMIQEAIDLLKKRGIEKEHIVLATMALPAPIYLKPNNELEKRPKTPFVFTNLPRTLTGFHNIPMSELGLNTHEIPTVLTHDFQAGLSAMHSTPGSKTVWLNKRGSLTGTQIVTGAISGTGLATGFAEFNNRNIVDIKSSERQHILVGSIVLPYNNGFEFTTKESSTNFDHFAKFIRKNLEPGKDFNWEALTSGDILSYLARFYKEKHKSFTGLDKSSLKDNGMINSFIKKNPRHDFSKFVGSAYAMLLGADAFNARAIEPLSQWHFLGGNASQEIAPWLLQDYYLSAFEWAYQNGNSRPGLHDRSRAVTLARYKEANILGGAGIALGVGNGTITNNCIFE